MGPEDALCPVTYYWAETPDGPWHQLNNLWTYRDLSQFFIQANVARELWAIQPEWV
jgi:hypothetical protein